MNRRDIEILFKKTKKKVKNENSGLKVPNYAKIM